MTKISFINPQDCKHLDKSGDGIYIRKNTVFRRTRKQPPSKFIYNPIDNRFKISLKRHKVHAIAKDISFHWKTLSNDQKAAWNAYSVYPPVYSTGYKAFFSNNMRLKRPALTCLGWIDDITSPPVPPVTPAGISVQFMSYDSCFCVGWSAPLCVNVFMQAFSWVPPGRIRNLSQPFKYSETINSANGLLSIDTTELQKAGHSLIKMRSLNLRGESSISVDITDTIKNAWPPGRYGIARYAYSVYGPNG
jgi:hypothetical protein